MADKVLFQDGDALSEQNLQEVLALENQTDYVVRGLGFTADFNDDTLDIGSGYAVIESAFNEAFHVFPDSASGLSLTANDVNHVFVDIDPNNDNITYHIDTDDTDPADPSLKIGTVDTSANTVSELNRNPSVSADKIDTSSGYVWGDQTSNRSLDTWQQAPSDRDIEFVITVEASSSATISLAVDISTIQSPNSAAEYRETVDSNARVTSGAYRVPAGQYYQVRAFGDTGSYSLRSWSELR